MAIDGSFAGEPHDVLAAEEFAFPAGADVSPLRLPDDPTGADEAHDVLAAEEFAMPSGPDRSALPARRAVPPALVIAALLALAWLLRRR